MLLILNERADDKKCKIALEHNCEITDVQRSKTQNNILNEYLIFALKKCGWKFEFC